MQWYCSVRAAVPVVWCYWHVCYCSLHVQLLLRGATGICVIAVFTLRGATGICVIAVFTCSICYIVLLVYVFLQSSLTGSYDAWCYWYMC